MRSEASSDVFKVWLYAAASVLLGTWFSPLLYNAGKALAEVSSAKQTNGALEWLAGLCRAADFTDFFVSSLTISALLLFLPLIHWLRGGRSADREKVWALRLPEGARSMTGGQPLLKNRAGLRQMITGFLLVTVLFLLIAGMLILAGILEWKAPEGNLAKIAARGFAMALGLALFQEILFRGIAMGIFLRAMRPAAALGLSTVLFALVHFLSPPPAVHVLDPDAAGVGFELLKKIATQFSDISVVLGIFTPLLALGGILAYARWRTASLCLPIGIHCGWIFVNAILGSITVAASRPHSVMWVLAGTSLRQGLVRLVGILLAGVLTNYLTNTDDATDTPP